MSRLSKLLARLCPNGVEYKRFSEVCLYIRGVTYGKSQEIRSGEDGWKVLRANNITLSTNSLNYDDVKVVSKNVKVKPAQLLKKGDILICAGSGSKEHVGKVAYISEDSDCTFGGFMAVIRAQNGDIDTRYLYHVLTSALFINYLKSALNSTTINNLSNSVVGPFEIPLPPLEIQREVVEILDKFAQLTAELTAELAKRKKQYSHYRDSLFSFGDGVPRIRIGDLTTVFSAARVHKNEWKEEGVPFYRSSDVTSWHNHVENPRGKAYISQELFEELSAKSGKFHKGDVFVTGGGSIGLPYILPFEGPFYVKDADLICIQKNDRFESKFLYYYFLSTEFRDYLNTVSHGATIAHYTISQVEKTIIPLPSMEEQRRIVDLLDRFDALCNSLSEGLPAEIALRKKQYEYYRDKLLSFKEAS